MAPASQELLAFQDGFKHGSIYVHSPDFNSFVLWSWRLSAQPRAYKASTLTLSCILKRILICFCVGLQHWGLNQGLPSDQRPPYPRL